MISIPAPLKALAATELQARQTIRFLHWRQSMRKRRRGLS